QGANTLARSTPNGAQRSEADATCRTDEGVESRARDRRARSGRLPAESAPNPGARDAADPVRGQPLVDTQGRNGGGGSNPPSSGPTERIPIPPRYAPRVHADRLPTAFEARRRSDGSGQAAARGVRSSVTLEPHRDALGQISLLLKRADLIAFREA